MKVVAVIASVLLIATATFAGEEGEYDPMKARYEKKKISGTVFTICGLSAGTIGTLLMVGNQESAYSYSGGGSAGVGFTSVGGGVGFMLALSAVPTTIVGIVKLAKARRGLRAYQ